MSVHLTRAQRRDLIARALRADPSRSDAAIGTELGANDKTVKAVRKGLEATSEIPVLAATRGRDGKVRHRRSAPAPARADPQPPDPQGNAPLPGVPTPPCEVPRWRHPLYIASALEPLADELRDAVFKRDPVARAAAYRKVAQANRELLDNLEWWADRPHPHPSASDDYFP